MNKWVAVLAVSLPVAAIIGVLVDSVPQNIPIPDEKIGLPEAPQLPSWIEEPLPDAPQVLEAEVVAPLSLGFSSSRAAEAQMRMEMRAAVEEDFRRLIGLAPDERQQDPDWPRIPALPGVSGFEIQQCTPDRICVSDRLAKEADDPTWARPMESMVFEAISRVATDPPNSLHVVCRAKTCGILMPGIIDPAGAPPIGKLLYMGERLTEELELPFATVAVRRDFQAIYLTKGEIKLSGVSLQ